MLHIAELRWSHLWPVAQRLPFTQHGKALTTNKAPLTRFHWKRHWNPDDNTAHRPPVRIQKLFSFQQAPSGVLHISSWNQNEPGDCRDSPHSCKKAQTTATENHRARVCATVTALLLQLFVPPKSRSLLLRTHSLQQKQNHDGKRGPASNTFTSWNMRR